MLNEEFENEIEIPQTLEKNTIVIGSRKSKLAMIQTKIVIDELKKHYPNYEFAIKNIDTIGDNILDKPLAQIGEKSLFTKELEEELLDGKIDLIVHSLKDMPTKLPDKCCIGAILKREDPTDSLVFRKSLVERLSLSSSFQGIEQVLESSSSLHIKTFGTSSLRRVAQLKSFPFDSQIIIKDVRGNLNTRLDKLDNHLVHGYDCLILATAGLKRAGFDDRINLKLDKNWYHAVSQGALGVECRTNDFPIIQMLQPLVDAKSVLECTTERVFMKCLEGGCSVPIGVQTKWNSSLNFKLTLQAKVLSVDGKQSIEEEMTKDLDDDFDDQTIYTLPDFTDIYVKINLQPRFTKRLKNAVILGRAVADKMLDLGVKKILEKKDNINHK